MKGTFGWLLVLALGLVASSAAFGQSLASVQANAKRAAGQQWWYFHRIGSGHWGPEYHPERKGLTLLHFMQSRNKKKLTLYVGSSHRYHTQLEALPFSSFVVFRYTAEPQQKETQYSTAYLIPIKYAPVQRGGKPGKWKRIRP